MHLKNTEEITIVNYWIKRFKADKIEATQRKLWLLLLIYHTLPPVEGVNMPKYPLPQLYHYDKYKTRNEVVTKQFIGQKRKPLDIIKQHLVKFLYEKFKKMNLDKLTIVATTLRADKKMNNKKHLTHSANRGIIDTRKARKCTTPK